MKHTFTTLRSFIKPVSLALILSLGIGIAYAWTPPTATPPNANTPTPLNVGTIEQAKQGIAAFLSGIKLVRNSPLPTCTMGIKGLLSAFSSTPTSIATLSFCDGTEWKGLGGVSSETSSSPSLITMTAINPHTRYPLTTVPGTNTYYIAPQHPVVLKILTTADLKDCTLQGLRGGVMNTWQVDPLSYETPSFKVLATAISIEDYREPFIKRTSYDYKVECTSSLSGGVVGKELVLDQVPYKSFLRPTSMMGGWNESFEDLLTRMKNNSPVGTISGAEILYTGYPYVPGVPHWGYEGSLDGIPVGSYVTCNARVVNAVSAFNLRRSNDAKNMLFEELLTYYGNNSNHFRLVRNATHTSSGTTCDESDRIRLDSSGRFCSVPSNSAMTNPTNVTIRCVSYGTYDVKANKFLGEPGTPGHNIVFHPISSKNTNMRPSLTDYYTTLGGGTYQTHVYSARP